MRKLLLLLILSAFFWAESGNAQVQRLLPSTNVKRGITGDPRPMPAVIIGNELLKLAPGCVIFNAENRTILQQDLPRNADVLYQFDISGLVSRIYILTPDEQARLNLAARK